MHNYLVFDLEIKNTIDGKNVTWADFGKMDISVGCAFNSRTHDYGVFMDDNIECLFNELENAEIVTGFNIKGFDIPLLEATVGRPFMPKGEVYDMLEWSRRSVGWDQSKPFPKGLRLDNHLEATFGKENMKTANGAEAPLMWQQNRIGELISYCLADVRRERDLFEHILTGKPVKTEMHGERIIDLPKLMRKK